MKLKEALEKAREHFEAFHKYDVEKSGGKHQNVQDYLVNKHIYEKAMKAISKQMVNSCGLDSALNALPNKDQESLKSFYIVGLPKYVKNVDKEAYDALIHLINKEKIEKRLELYLELYKTFSPETQKILDQAKIENTSVRVNAIIASRGFDEAKDIIETSFKGEIDENIEIPDDVFDNVFEKPEIGDSHPYDEKIKNLIKTLDSEKDKEKIEALKEANEYIISGDEELRELTSQIAERYGTDCDRYQTNLNDESIKDMGFEGKVIQNVFATKDSEEITHIIDKAVETDFTIAESVKKEIIETSKFISEHGIVNEAVLTAEEGSKIYSMRSLVDKTNEIKKAIDENRFDDVVRLNKEYRELDKAYGEVTNKLANDDQKYIVSNISSSREWSVPSKYRNNYVGVTKLTSIWMINKFCRQSNIKVEELMDHPFDCILKIAKDSLKAASPETYNPDANFVDVLKQVKDDKGDRAFQNAKNSFATLSTGMCRSLGALQYFSDEYGTKGFGTQISLAMASVLGVANDISVMNKDVRERLVENYIVAEAGDRNLITMSTSVTSPKMGKDLQPFNKEEYIKEGKTNVESIIKRMAEIKGIDNNKYQENINHICDFIKGLDIEKSESVNKYLDMLSDPKTRLYGGDIKAINARANLTNELKNKDVKSLDELKETIKSLADMQKDYNSRNFLKKLFGTGTKRLKSEIDNLKETIITKTEITADSLKDAIKEAINPKKPSNDTNAIAEDKKSIANENEVRKPVEIGEEVKADATKEIEKEDDYEFVLEGLDAPENTSNTKEM